MTRTKPPQDTFTLTAPAKEPENAAPSEPLRHSVRESMQRKTLERMAGAFRTCESARTAAWMAVEHKPREEAVAEVRQEFEREA